MDAFVDLYVNAFVDLYVIAFVDLYMNAFVGLYVDAFVDLYVNAFDLYVDAFVDLDLYVDAFVDLYVKASLHTKMLFFQQIKCIKSGYGVPVFATNFSTVLRVVGVLLDGCRILITTQFSIPTDASLY
jgi:hypothetical protein